MTLSQIRSQVDALCRKYHRELAIYRAAKIANEISRLWMIAVANKQPSPTPSPASGNSSRQASASGPIWHFRTICSAASTMTGFPKCGPSSPPCSPGLPTVPG